MTVRKRKWSDKQGRQHEKWMIHIEHTWPDGRKQTIRKVSPVQTKRGAEQYERELRAQILSGHWNGGHKKQTPTVEGFAEEFLAYQATLNKPTEMDNKRMILRAHLIPAFGKRRLDEIDERAIDAYTVKKLAQPSNRGGLLLPQTVNKHLKLLGRMFRVAMKWKLIREMPEVSVLKERKPEFDFLDFEEADAFIAAAAQHEPEWHPFVVVAVRTGLRIGELVALRWREDVDLERRRLTVQQSYSQKHGFMTTKNDKIRELPLTWDATEALRVQRSRVDGDLVFAGPEGGVLAGDKANEALTRISETIEMRSFTNHNLRHSFASHAVMRGISIRQVQEWLGHGSVVVTMRYAHLARGVGDELIQLLSPDPEDGGQSPRGAARSQHTDSTRKRPKSKPAAYTPVVD
jgi:integrase